MKSLVKLGGTLLDSEDSRDGLARQIAAARSAGHEITVVHGGGKQMTRYLAERGIQSTFVGGLRVTTPETLDAVLKVFAGSVNHELVAAINRAGGLAVGISGIDTAWSEQMNAALGAGQLTVQPAFHLLTARLRAVVACVAADRQGHVNVTDQMTQLRHRLRFASLFLTDVGGPMPAKQVIADGILWR
jgi:acetylglutamate kinase